MDTFKYKKLNGQWVELATKELVDTIDALVSKIVPETITGTLLAGETTVTLVNASITSDSIIEIYTDIYRESPKAVEVTTGAVTLTFTPLDTDLNIRLEVRN